MNILLLGATGRVGRLLLEQALADGHRVTALVRSPEKLHEIWNENLQMKHERLNVIQGDATNAADLERALEGADAVASALSTDGGTVLTDAMPPLIAAMERRGVKRILTIGTAGILQSRAEPELLRYLSSESKRALTRASEEHRRAYEALAASDLDWTIICPTYLPDEPAQGEYRHERDFLPEGGGKISVADTAEFAYRQLFSDQYLRARVGLAY